VAYRQARGVEADGAAIGVLVQRMVAAKVSGVAFTLNPVTGANELVINTAPGLGEALVSGQVEPDEFVVDKHDVSITATRLGSGRTTPTLPAERILDLAALLLKIESHYGAPQDIEFCFDGDKLWIVQSRPVTTTASGLQSSGVSAQSSVVASASVAQWAAMGGHTSPTAETEWTRANLAEVFPEQLAPQVLAAYDDVLNRGQSQFMGKFLAPEFGPMFKPFHGRMYMNFSQMRRVAALGGAPVADLMRSLGHPEPITPADEVGRRAPIRAFLPLISDIIRLAKYDLRAATLFRKHEQETEETIARLRQADPRTLSDREIGDMFQWWLQIVPESIQIVFVMSGVLFRERSIKKACEAVGYSYEKLVYPQLAAGPRSVSGQQAIDLVGLAATARADARVVRYFAGNDASFRDVREALNGTEFLSAFDRFIETYGHRGRYESDWSIPRLHEDPTPALFAIREQLKAPAQDIAALTERQEADAARAWREFEARMTWWQKLTLLPRVRSTIKRLKRQYVWRERVRFDLTRILRYARPYHLALAARFVERGWIATRDDYFLIRLEEIGSVIADPSKGPTLRSIVASRKAQLAAERDLQLPLLMRESELASLMAQVPTPTLATDGDLTGLCVSPGSVEAEVVVMRDPSEFAQMKRGAILVTRATDPSWTPLFTLASGVVVEVGGMLSHASTIAREYGLPALANVKDATRRLKTGDRVKLDASGGRVQKR
jgi:pyruvate,water dikinase